MSNPPFGNPIYSDDDFSFPNNYTPSSSVPNSEYQDLSMFLDDDEENYPLIIGQLNSPNIETQETSPNWVEQNDDPHMQHDPITMIDDQVVVALEVGQGSCTKKLNHNAKERVRRMKLNDTFLALRALLPQSRRAKKRWSAPYVIDRALEYIPELQKQIEKQTLEKDNMLSVIGNKQAISTEHDQHVLPKQVHNNSATLTVSINQVKDGEVIIQICEDKDKVGVLTTLFDKLEAEGLKVLGASSLCASQDRSCFHIHIQVIPRFDSNWRRHLIFFIGKMTLSYGQFRTLLYYCKSVKCHRGKKMVSLLDISTALSTRTLQLSTGRLNSANFEFSGHEMK